MPFGMPFGEIPGNPEGTPYPDRAAVRTAGVHLPPRHGIAGRAAVGAESIVVSGGYEDDEDFGNLILYTGAGGRGEDGAQVADQVFAAQNQSLVKAASTDCPCASSARLLVTRSTSRTSAITANTSRSPNSGRRARPPFCPARARTTGIPRGVAASCNGLEPGKGPGFQPLPRPTYARTTATTRRQTRWNRSPTQCSAHSTLCQLRRRSPASPPSSRSPLPGRTRSDS
jgi:SAD/SRA domain